MTSKRGVLLSLALRAGSKPCAWRAPHRAVGDGGRSAGAASWLAPVGQPPVPLVLGQAGAAPRIRILKSAERVPWSGHSSRYAIPEVYEEIQPGEDDADLRQHAQPGRDGVPGAVGGQ